VRLLFSAHGLPKRTSDAGDPYRWQVEQTCGRVMERLSDLTGRMWDWRLCFQSRVGPLKWIGPDIADEIERAGADGKGVIVDPIAFVSEHVETLVELDRDYAAMAERVAALPYLRVPTVRDDPAFIGGLANLVVKALAQEGLHPGGPACGPTCLRCALKTRKAA
jgi:protoporphyrin/coproporphyrin ferrochelatase